LVSGKCVVVEEESTSSSSSSSTGGPAGDTTSSEESAAESAAPGSAEESLAAQEGGSFAKVQQWAEANKVKLSIVAITLLVVVIGLFVHHQYVKSNKKKDQD
jgi:hypothetical protein